MPPLYRNRFKNKIACYAMPFDKTTINFTTHQRSNLKKNAIIGTAGAGIHVDSFIQIANSLDQACRTRNCMRFYAYFPYCLRYVNCADRQPCQSSFRFLVKLDRSSCATQPNRIEIGTPNRGPLGMRKKQAPRRTARGLPAGEHPFDRARSVTRCASEYSSRSSRQHCRHGRHSPSCNPRHAPPEFDS